MVDAWNSILVIDYRSTPDAYFHLKNHKDNYFSVVFDWKKS
jgi:hypothetical protein